MATSKPETDAGVVRGLASGANLFQQFSSLHLEAPSGAHFFACRRKFIFKRFLCSPTKSIRRFYGISPSIPSSHPDRLYVIQQRRIP
jgi:hypothetical protein